MRIVHEVYEDAQTTATGSAYACRVDHPPKWLGCQAEIKAGFVGNDEAIHIEGDLEVIRDMLKQWVYMLDEIETEEREKFDKMATELTQCAACMCWRKPGAPHADGKGGECDK